MLIDGVKMACEACIRGHRVSGCTHTDRQLKPIAKKGRPVTQCSHCRQLRRAKSAHVKCDCAERTAARKRSKAASNGEVEGDATSAGRGCTGSHAGVDATSTTPDGESKSVSDPCQCGHGGRCTCALKKESSLGIVPEYSAPESDSSMYMNASKSHRPRISTAHSDTALVVYANPANYFPASLLEGSMMVPGAPANFHSMQSRNSPPMMPPYQRFNSDPSPLQTRTSNSGQSSPEMRVYPCLQMAGSTEHIGELELTPRGHSHQPHQPHQQQKHSKPRLRRTTSGRVPSLNINTSHTSISSLNCNFESLASADSDYLISAGLYTPHSAGWPPAFQPNGLSSFHDDHTEDYPPPIPEAEVDFFALDRNPFLGSTDDIPALTNSTSGDELDGSLYGVPAGTTHRFDGNAGLISAASSELGDQEAYALSNASSYMDLPQFAKGPGSFVQSRAPSVDYSNANSFLMNYSQQNSEIELLNLEQQISLQQPPEQQQMYQQDQFDPRQEQLQQQQEYSTMVQQPRVPSPLLDDDGIWMGEWNQADQF